MVEQQLDRFINIDLLPKKGSKAGAISLKTPAVGVKQEMRLSGSFLPTYVASDLILRCTNFYTKDSLDLYDRLRITAGYTIGQSMISEGPLVLPYLEKPSPDSITVFRILGIAFNADYIFAHIVHTWEEGTTVEEVLNDCKDYLSTLYGISIGLYYHTDVIKLEQKLVADNNMSVRDVVQLLLRMYPSLRIVVRGNSILAYNALIGLNVVHTLQQISMAIKNGPAVSIHAPWDPTILPGDIVRLNTIFFKQGLGSSLLSFNSIGGSVSTGTLVDFIVNTVDFSFSTNRENTMIINAVTKGTVRGNI